MKWLELRARDFATFHHGDINQVRRYTNEEYIVHPAAVVELVRSVRHTEEMLAAAWLHDTVEDTRATLDDVRHAFGDSVATLVEMLTDVSKPTDGNRAARKRIDREHLALASNDAQTIKIADLMDNSLTIVKHDRNFARVFLPEKAILLDVLTGGDSILWNQAKELLTKNMINVFGKNE